MANKPNKVKFGLSDVHYAKVTFSEDGEPTFATPVRIPGAVSLSMDPIGEPEKWHADDVVYYVSMPAGGYDGDLEIAIIPESFLIDILHDELDSNGVIAERDDVELEHFALLFSFNGDKRKTRHVLYNCTASRPSIEGETVEDTREPQPDTLTLSATALVNGYVKAKTGSTTTAEVYNNWFKEVYIPQPTAEEADPEPEQGQG